jgi:hypothetical protein
MPEVKLDAADAAELAEMLQFISQWLARDPGHLAASLARFVVHPAYGLPQLRQDLERFVFLLGGSDGEPPLRPLTRLPCQPSLRWALPGLNVVRPRADALRALHVDPRRGTSVNWHQSGNPRGNRPTRRPARRQNV